MAMIQFKQCAVLDKIKTESTGKQTYQDGVEATITLDRRNTIVFQFSKRDKDESVADFNARLPLEIKNYWMPNLEAYLNGVEFTDGTPLTSMTWLSMGQIETLRSAGIGSVEALAKVSDGVLEPFSLDGAALKKQALAWLDDKSGEAVAKIESQQKKIDALEEERKEQRDMIEKLSNDLNELKAQKAKKK